MPTFDASQVRCHVYTFKEGLLSAVGHDVLLGVQKLEVKVDGARLEATFDASSLKVVHAMKDGAPNPGALSDKDKQTIEGYVREDVLHSRRYPKIRFVSTELPGGRASGLPEEDEPQKLTGQLELHGRTRTIEVKVALVDDRLVARVRLHQPDFGIAPFRALLGTLRIQAHVEVEVSIPKDAIASAAPVRP